MSTLNGSTPTTPATLPPTPGQTVGPFFGYAMPYADGPFLVQPGTTGAIRLQGTVYDGSGDFVPDALLEIWQPDADGIISREPGSLIRDGYTFTGFGRAPVNGAGTFTFTTVNPGAVNGGAPFISVVVFARGLMNRLHTRIYLPENQAALDTDPLLSSLDPERRKTLIGTRAPDGGLQWDVRLQGEDETVFLQFAGY